MEALGWIASTLWSIAGLAVSLIWFLISGWVSTLLQITVLIFAIYGMKYGWRRAPFEIWRRTASFGRIFWNWIRARDPDAPSSVEVREVIREIRFREPGDINLSTGMSLLVLIGLAALAMP
jgi:hypothetical protein